MKQEEELLPHPPSVDRSKILKDDNLAEFTTPPPKVPFSPFSPENLKSNTLKKKNVITAFSKYDIENQIEQQKNMQLRERMRELDNFHLHRPHLEDECEFLNLPNNRMNLHTVKELTYLCGGLVGVRFDGDEFKLLHTYAAQLQSLWLQLEQSFKELSTPDLKLTPNTASELTPTATRFSNIADEYMQVIKSLQLLVCKKQSTIDRSNAITTGIHILYPLNGLLTSIAGLF